MKGQMKVKKLNDTGLYISEMDWDNTYICKENPIGNFVMVINHYQVLMAESFISIKRRMDI